MSVELGVILASASPRRSLLLAEAGVEFEVIASNVNEDFEPHLTPEQVACELAERKALHVAKSFFRQNKLVIGSDTIVAAEVEGEIRILGKPEDAEHAAEMLGWLSASRHRVLTGVCVADCRDGSKRSDYERTWVTMREIAPKEIADYVASEEWRGKAGAYAIQESADAFVTQLEEGGFDNVVGLPVELTLSLLRSAGY